MRALFDCFPQFNSEKLRNVSAFELLNSEEYFNDLCEFFNWFLYFVNKKYIESPK